MEHIQEALRLRSVGAGPQDGLLVHDLGTLPVAPGGCVVEFSFTLPAVPPDTRTAVALTLLELDGAGRGG